MQSSSDALKAKILNYDKTSKHRPDITDFDKEYISSKNNDTKKTDHELDLIKQMDTLMMHAKVSTIRDRQLEERKGMEQMYLNKEKRLDTMMELERLKEIQFQEMKEKEIKRQQKEGANIIIEQIKENEVERLKKKEQKERERIQMIRQIEAMAEEDKRNAEMQRKRNEIRMKEAL